MEFLNWKNILLEWANRLNYVGRAQFSLSMLEIEPFYREYQASVTSIDISSKRLDSFLSDYFPQFDPIWNEEGKLSTDDYVYVYSLLMFFVCVKHPDEKIQIIYRQMETESQMVVGAFLKNLLDSNSFYRKTINGVIELSVPAELPDYVLECTQLEAERTEPGLLETQLKASQEEIDNLHQERRKFFAEIRQLKFQATDNEADDVPDNCNKSPVTITEGGSQPSHIYVDAIVLNEGSATTQYVPLNSEIHTPTISAAPEDIAPYDTYDFGVYGEDDNNINNRHRRMRRRREASMCRQQILRGVVGRVGSAFLENILEISCVLIFFLFVAIIIATLFYSFGKK